MIGGEIFLYKGWEILSRHLVTSGVRVNIVSNGYQIGQREIEQIKHARLVNVGISIDGLEAVHNLIRRRPDAFSRLRAGIALLRREGIPVGAVTTVMAVNHSDLEGLYHFLVEQGIEVWQLQLASPMGSLAKAKNTDLSLRQLRKLTDFIREKNQERRLVAIAADSVGYFDDNECYIRGRSAPIPCWAGCQAGLSTLFIDSVGNVKGCGALYSDVFIEGNLRNTPLADIWNSPSAFRYNREFTVDLLSGKCKGCEDGPVCKGGCRSSNYFRHRSLYSSVMCSRRG
jgi:radical SAM protein with 4Fe4S-binding SPASM domain